MLEFTMSPRNSVSMDNMYLQGRSSSAGDVVWRVQIHGTVQHSSVRLHSHTLLCNDDDTFLRSIRLA